jgi:hypothetical protein
VDRNRTKSYDPLEIARIAFGGQLDELKADRQLTECFLGDKDWYKRVGALSLLAVHFKLPEPELAVLRERLMANSSLELERMYITLTVPSQTAQNIAFGDRLGHIQADRSLIDHFLNNGTFDERMGALCILNDYSLTTEERGEIAEQLMLDPDPRVRINAMGFEARPFLYSRDRKLCERFASIALDEKQHESVRIAAAHLAMDVWFPNPLAAITQRSENLAKLTPERKQEWLESRAEFQIRRANRQKGLLGIDWDWVREMACFEGES